MKKDQISKQNVPAPSYSFTLTFNPEIFRISAYIALIIMLVAGYILTTTLVHVDPTSTAIYHIFGFNHACNLIDHEPSRTVSAMLLPFWEVPFLLYVVFNFLRINDAYRENKLPAYIYRIALGFLPFEVLLTVWFRIVFVWSPEVSFLMHYLPYIGFQILLSLTAIENVLYFDAVKSLPFNNNRPLAIGYLVFLIGVTVVYVYMGMSAALGYMDIANTPALSTFAEILSRVYTVIAIPVPLFLSIMEMRRSPKHSLTIA